MCFCKPAKCNELASDKKRQKNIGLVIPILCRGIVFPGREQRQEKLLVSAVLKEDRLLIFSDWKILAFGGCYECWYTEDRFTLVPSGFE
jgi:hypothetical protein